MNGTSSSFDGILFFMPIQFVIVFLIGLINKKAIAYSILIFLLIFWLFINRYKFINRHACWSTFSDTEILKAVLLIITYLYNMYPSCIFYN